MVYGDIPVLISKNISRSYILSSLPAQLVPDHREYNQAAHKGTTGASISGKINNDDNNDYITIDEKSENSYKIVRCRKTRTITVHSLQLRDISGKLVTDIDTASFVMNSGSSTKGSKSRRKASKIPKVGNKTFGNEGVPKISHHLNPLKNYLFCQFLPVAEMSPQTIGQVYNWSWTVSLMEGISSYTSLFDQYCVRRIEVWFLPSVTEQSVINNKTPLYYVAYDPDGSSNTTAGDLRQYDDVVITNLTEGQYHCFTPSVAVATYGGAFTKYSFEMNQWLDVANTDISLYGLTAYVDPVVTNGDFKIAQQVRLWVEFRGVR